LKSRAFRRRVSYDFEDRDAQAGFSFEGELLVWKKSEPKKSILFWEVKTTRKTKETCSNLGVFFLSPKVAETFESLLALSLDEFLHPAQSGFTFCELLVSEFFGSTKEALPEFG
jgi:hypothetical protein